MSSKILSRLGGIVSRALAPSVPRSEFRIPGRVKSKTEKLAPATSMVSVHHLRSG